MQGSGESPTTTSSIFYSEVSPRKIEINPPPKKSEEKEEEEGFVVERQEAVSSEMCYFEQPESPCQLAYYKLPLN